MKLINTGHSNTNILQAATTPNANSKITLSLLAFPPNHPSHGSCTSYLCPRRSGTSPRYQHTQSQILTLKGSVSHATLLLWANCLLLFCERAELPLLHKEHDYLPTPFQEQEASGMDWSRYSFSSNLWYFRWCPVVARCYTLLHSHGTR